MEALIKSRRADWRADYSSGEAWKVKEYFASDKVGRKKHRQDVRGNLFSVSLALFTFQSWRLNPSIAFMV